MKSEQIKKILAVLFLFVGGISVLEFLFIQGMFTSLMVMLAVAVFGLSNITFSLIQRQYIQGLHYALTSVALCMPYVLLM